MKTDKGGKKQLLKRIKFRTSWNERSKREGEETEWEQKQLKINPVRSRKSMPSGRQPTCWLLHAIARLSNTIGPLLMTVPYMEPSLNAKACQYLVGEYCNSKVRTFKWPVSHHNRRVKQNDRVVVKTSSPFYAWTAAFTIKAVASQ